MSVRSQIESFVNGPVTIVIGSITQFGRAWMDGGIVIIAVHQGAAGSLGLVAVSIRVCTGRTPFVHGAVAVIVDTIAEFGRSWVNVRIVVIAISCHRVAVMVVIRTNRDRAQVGVGTRRYRHALGYRGLTGDLNDEAIGASRHVFEKKGAGCAQANGE